MAICFPVASGVPFAGGPPVWWNDVDGSLPQLNNRFEDPRWRGCTRTGLGAPGAGEDPVFRALHAVDGAGKTWLHLSWIVRASNSQDPSHAVLVGFQRAGAPGLVLRATPFRAGADPLPPPAGSNRYQLGSTRLFVLPDTTAGAAAPSWLGTFGRMFTSGLGGAFWAVHLRIPIKHAGPDIDDDGINIGAAGSTFKLGFEVKVTLQGGGAAGPYTFPRGAAFALGSPATWEDTTIGGASCGQVVSINSSQIRSDPPPASTINFTAAGAPGAPNTLVASPLNSTGAAVAQNAIRARFFIANWGSQPDPNQALGIWSEILPGTVATNPSAISNGAAGDIPLAWTVEEPMLSEFRSGARWDHQCMLVELSGGGLSFSPSSAARNMDFVSASKFTRDAQISVRGLPDPGTPQRDVYLLVKTTNMPARVEPPPPQPDPGPAIAGRRERVAAENDRDDDGEYEVEVDPYATDLDGFDLIARDHPTYVVYAFHDTGEIDAESGLRRLAPQVPFGYVVSHDGALAGWEHELTGANLTLVGPDLYRLHVPTNGDAVVTTRIEALERPVTWWERFLRWLLAHLRKLCRRLWRKLRALLRRH